MKNYVLKNVTCWQVFFLLGSARTKYCEAAYVAALKVETYPYMHTFFILGSHSQIDSKYRSSHKKGNVPIGQCGLFSGCSVVAKWGIDSISSVTLSDLSGGYFVWSVFNE